MYNQAAVTAGQHEEAAQEVPEALLDATADDDPWNVARPDRKERRKQEWLIAHTDLSASTKTLLRALALHMKHDGGLAWVSLSELGRNASLAQATVYKCIREAKDARVLVELVSPNEPTKRMIRVQPELPEAVRALQVLWRTDRAESPLPATDARDVVRYYWDRELMKSDLPAPTKGVGWAVSLLMRANGEPIRYATLDELAAFSGHGRTTVQRQLKILESEGWIDNVPARGRGNGCAVRLRLQPLAHVGTSCEDGAWNDAQFRRKSGR